MEESAEMMLRLVKLVDKIPDDFPLWVKTRKFILQDEGYIRFESEKKLKRCQCVLFSDLLFVYASHKKLGRKARETAEMVTTLDDTVQTTEEEDPVSKNPALKVISKGQTYYFTFDSVSKFTEWSDKINIIMKK